MYRRGNINIHMYVDISAHECNNRTSADEVRPTCSKNLELSRRVQIIMYHFHLRHLKNIFSENFLEYIHYFDIVD